MRVKDVKRDIAPRHGLDGVVLAADLSAKLDRIVQFEKAKSLLFGQWGFEEAGHSPGTVVLFWGPPGTGKTLASTAVAYDLGKVVKVVNCSELVSKWVGETSKNLESIFTEARAEDAVLVFDEADGVFGLRVTDGSSNARHCNTDTGVLLHLVENHPGIVILTTNLRDNIDPAFHRRFRMELEFPMPSQGLRESLWTSLIPKATPLSDDVDFSKLAVQYDFTGGSMKNVVLRAATRAALRADDCMLHHQDLVEECMAEISKTAATNPGGMFL